MVDNSDDVVGAAVHDASAALLPKAEDIAAQLAEYIAEQIPEFDRRNSRAILISSCTANMVGLLDALARGVALDSIAPSVEVLQLTRDLAQRSFPLKEVRRAYRVGSQHMSDLWTDAVAAHTDGSVVVPAIKAGMHYILRWVEVIVDRLDDEYRHEEERLARERTLARVEDVRHVLTHPEVDADTATARLGYRLHGTHLAVVLRERSDVTDAGKALDAAIRELAAALDSRPGLTLRVDMRTAWCWLPHPAVGQERLRRLQVPVLAGVGRPGRGLEGFRRSHHEALDALRVAELGGDPSAITYYDDVDIAALCSVEPDRCHDFIRTELRGLTANDNGTLRQRETLTAFFAANSNYRATAANLGIHHNTVRYRLEQAENTVGHPLRQRRLALELALHLHAIVGLNDRRSHDPRTPPARR